MLVPYEYLDEHEKASVGSHNILVASIVEFALLQESSRRNASELVKVMICFKYRFELGVGCTAVDPADLCKVVDDDVAISLERR